MATDEEVDWNVPWRTTTVLRMGYRYHALEVIDRVDGKTQYAVAAILTEDGERIIPDRVGLTIPVDGLNALVRVGLCPRCYGHGSIDIDEGNLSLGSITCPECKGGKRRAP